MLKHLFILAAAALAFNQARAVDAVTFAYGQGEPAELRVGMLGVQWDFKPIYSNSSGWKMIVLADLQFAYWATNSVGGGNREMGTVAAAPLLRIQKEIQSRNLIPYIDGGVGFGLYTANNIGGNKLGAVWGFENKVGAGLMFGNNKQYDISYHYLLFSNYGIYKDNAGFAANWLLTFAYHFK